MEDAHLGVLSQLVSMEKWVDKHLDEICRGAPGRTEGYALREHKKNFTEWIKEQDIPTHANTEESKLARGPSSQITTWQGFDINGYRFHTKDKDTKSASQNSGVRYEGIDERTKQIKTYYGQIEEIWELDYGDDLQIPIFQCKWVKSNAVVVDDYGLITVDLASVGFQDDEWVLANRVAQVAYFAKPNTKRHVVVSGKQRIVGADGIETPEGYNNYAELSLFTDHPNKIKNIETRLSRTAMKPWFRPDGEKKTVAAPAKKDV